MEDKSGDANAPYETSVAGLNELGSLLKTLIASTLSVKGIQAHSIEYRVKEKDSALRKFMLKGEKYKKLTDLTDLLGVRVIAYFEDDVDKISRLVEQEFRVDSRNSIDKREALDSTQFGYLSVHYILSLGEARSRLVEYSRYASVRFELQIRTVLQHAWAEIEHDLGYKGSRALSAELRRRFSRIAGLLEIADAEFASLRNEVHAYDTEIGRNIRTRPESFAVDQATVLGLLTKDPEVSRIDSEIVRETAPEAERVVNTEYLSRLVVELRGLGFEEISELRRIFVDNRVALGRFAKEWVLRGGLFRTKHVPVGGGLRFLILFLLATFPATFRAQKIRELDIDRDDSEGLSRKIREIYDATNGSVELK